MSDWSRFATPITLREAIGLLQRDEPSALRDLLQENSAQLTRPIGEYINSPVEVDLCTS